MSHGIMTINFEPREYMNIDERVLEIINAKISSEFVSPDLKLEELNNIDSITFIKIIVELEVEFNFEFEDEKLLFSAFPTVQSMIEYVKERVSEINDN